MKIPKGIGRHNTQVFGDQDHFAVFLYRTMIYEENPNRVVLYHGGWITPTTARRINQVLAYRGYSPSVRISRGVMYYGDQPFDGETFVIQKGGRHENA